MNLMANNYIIGIKEPMLLFIKFIKVIGFVCKCLPLVLKLLPSQINFLSLETKTCGTSTVLFPFAQAFSRIQPLYVGSIVVLVFFLGR